VSLPLLVNSYCTFHLSGISLNFFQVQLLLDIFNNIGVVEARNGGRFEALSGNTTIQNLTDGTANGNAIANATLSDGTWAVYGNSTIAIANSTIARIDANVILDGPGSSFAALARLSSNVGSFALLHGRDFSTLGGFLNRGELTLGSGVDFRVADGFRSTNMLHVILAGSDIESFGQLSAGTSALLAGSLDVKLDQNYQPNLGDSFTIISAAFVSGTFESVTFPQLPGGEAMAISYAPDHVTLTVVPEPASMALALTITLCAARRRRGFIFRKLQPPN